MKENQSLVEYMAFLNEKTNMMFEQLRVRVESGKESDKFWLISKCNEYSNYIRDFSEVTGCKI